MHRSDSLVMLVAAASVWATLTFVSIEALPLAPSPSVRVALLASGVAVATFATAALVAVLVHLARKRDELYTEDLRHRGEVAREPREALARRRGGETR